MADKKEGSAPFSIADLGASLSGTATAGLVSVLKDKLQTLVGTSSGYIESLPDKVKRRIETLKQLQDQHKQLEDKFFEEKIALETKYQKLYDPFYKKRFEIVNGLVEVDVAKEDESKKEITDDEKGVPEFWLNAMKNNDVVGMQITERDEGALKFLKDVTWSRLDGEKGFKLEFFFSENPYFKNSVLTKTYIMVDENEPILDHATGTDIDWLPGKNVTQKMMKKKPKKGSKNAKPVTKIEQCPSFFNFFSPPKVPADEDEDVDDDAAEELQDLMEQDYEIGSTIRDKIIPHAVSWFTGEEGDDDDEYVSEDDDEADEDANSQSDESGEEDEEGHKGEDNGHQKA